MFKNWPAFLGGMTVALAIVWAVYAYVGGEPRQTAPPALSSVLDLAGLSADPPPASSPGVVTIRVLPSLYVLRGQDVPFQGRVEIPLDIGGRLVREIVVVAVQAGGENAHKSSVRIVWEDGSVENIPAGAKDIVFPPQRRAKKITVHGYSFHEQRVFKDVPKKGTLFWEIRYAVAE